MKKGQLSVEHLVIVGLSLMVILPSTLMLLNFAKNTSDLVNNKQIESIGNTLSLYGRDVYFKGKGNMVTLTFTLPENVKNLSVMGGDLFNPGSELVINYRSVKGPNRAVFFLDFPVIGPTFSGDEVIINRRGIVELMLNMTGSAVMVREK